MVPQFSLDCLDWVIGRKRRGSKMPFLGRFSRQARAVRIVKSGADAQFPSEN